MSTTTVRISEETREILRKIAVEEHQTIHSILERAVEEYEKAHFLMKVNEDFARLRMNQEAWAEYQEELEIWSSSTLSDFKEEPYFEKTSDVKAEN